MHQLVFSDNDICAPDTVEHLLTQASLYGRGVFTTVRISGGKALLWEKHWRRLSANAASIGLKMSEHSEPRVMAALARMIEANEVENGRARLTLFDASGSAVWQGSGRGKTKLLIMTGDERPRPRELRLTTSAYPINSHSPLAGIKSCNYLENLLAHDEAGGRGFDEAIRSNERGEIASACMANLFWVKNERVFTPSLRTGCLAGTNREYVMENVSVTEIDAELTALNEADVIFVTSAGLGIARAAELDGKRLGALPTSIEQLAESIR